ncbi:MAG TPA: M23 family metallopeptidase [Burkholderiaceae bacterium]|nr:M23 family metallopeptidase [Burkholderiaceae bacterium]HNB45315.1 M23 family metallopeptidase [Burkholderiaceae bacterium]HNG81706.1 M23 family metallopeptidase [Burkholderiaceae bacterium]
MATLNGPPHRPRRLALAAALSLGLAAVVGLAGCGSKPAAKTPPDPTGRSDVAELALRDLLIPVDGVRPDQLRNSFRSARSRGAHEAIDILAPRGTPVRAVEDGRIVRLSSNRAGGITIYQADAGERYLYYYAHLERYAPDLAEGQRVRRGDLLGLVGSSGNAPADAPHLHFAIHRIDPGGRRWPGPAINPFAVWRGAAEASLGDPR